MMGRNLLAAAAALSLMAAGAHAEWVWSPQTGRWINIDNLPKETAELQLEQARELMLDGKYDKAMRETNKFERFYTDSEFADENQFLRGEIEMARGDYVDAAEAFQAVIDNYPATDLYDEAIAKQYEIGDKLFERGQEKIDNRWSLFRKRPLKKASRVYGMVIENQPFTAAAAEAQYKLGLTEFTLDNHIEAAYEYRRVIEDYPGSDYVDEASYALAQTYLEQSLPPDYDQSPSRLAITAIERFTAQYPGDSRNEDLQASKQEMREKIAEHKLRAAKFYDKRREFVSAALYYEILAEDYSDTAAAEEAEAWLEAHSDVPRPGLRLADKESEGQ